ncbi:hypothetical protein L288_18510 [Sphingobium quisquiliarum P25]|uniref:Uncharacterized protein n=1 Tax=Sphingobium quisquiliarum P25 TaxID=1329909 RepID=T0G933_9SPHN|nr:hypothetical protein L288_18510 [Sphingobium quisquiliarum P25]
MDRQKMSQIFWFIDLQWSAIHEQNRPIWRASKL